MNTTHNKSIKRIAIAAIVLAVLIVAAVLIVGAMKGASAKRMQRSVADTVTDDYGRHVLVPSAPRRVVSLSPAVTEIMFALGADSLLVGRTDFCTYPPQAADIPSIGGISNLNIEQIVGREPDLVISGSMVAKKAVDQMESLGVPLVCVIEKPHFSALYDNITTIGRLIGRKREADSLNHLLHQREQSLPLPEDDAHSCYYVVGFGPAGNFTAGGNTFINDIIQMAGGRNIAADIEGWNYSMEALMHENPEFIIVRREDSASFCSMKPYSRLEAVRQGHVIGIESGMLDLQVPRNIDAILYLRQKFNQQ